MSTSFKNVPPGPVGVTFLKDVDIKFFLLINHI